MNTSPSPSPTHRFRDSTSSKGEQQPSKGPDASANVGEMERWASLVGGGMLALYGLGSRSLSGLALAALGGALIYRGSTGQCSMYRSLGINTAR